MIKVSLKRSAFCEEEEAGHLFRLKVIFESVKIIYYTFKKIQQNKSDYSAMQTENQRGDRGYYECLSCSDLVDNFI